MKKFLCISTLALSAAFMSCSNPPAVSATAQKNMDAMHAISKSFESKDFSKLGDYIAEDAVNHAGEMGDVKGLANMKAEFEKMVAANESSKSETIKELADDDYVMSWMHYTGTLKMPSMGMKSGDHYDMKALEVAKFKDGKATEHWTFMEPSEMMKMMPPPPPPSGTTMPMPMDSLKKESTKKM